MMKKTILSCVLALLCCATVVQAQEMYSSPFFADGKVWRYRVLNDFGPD